MTASSYPYLYHMRLLMSLLLSCCFFIAPVKTKAGDIPAHYVKKQDDKKKAGIVRYLLSDQHVALLTNNNHNTGAGQKNYSPANLINAFYSTVSPGVITGQRQIIPYYLYCKPIGLKLIFPKHYFW